MGGKSSPPPAPDYTAAAEKTAQASKEATIANTWANRVEQYTPWGNVHWSSEKAIDPATGQEVTQWTQQQGLNPQLQAALDAQLGLGNQRSQLASGFMDRVAQEYGQNFDWQNMPGAAQTPMEQFTQGRQMQSYLPTYNANMQQFNPMTTGNESLRTTNLDTSAPMQTTFTANQPNFVNERHRIEQELFNQMRPEHQFQEDRTRTMLANQGLTPGSEAYNRELERLAGQQAGERFNALNQAGGEQQRLHGMMMGQQQQAFNQDTEIQRAQNAAMQQLFQQRQAAGQFGLQADAQGFGQNVAAQEAYNRALAAQQGLNQASGNFYNQAMQQMYNQDLAGNAQNYAQMMQAAEYQNRLRQQAISEQMMARGMSLNEMNALLHGQQVQAPQMPSFATAAMPQTPNYLGAAQAQYGAAQDAYSAKQAQGSGLMSGIMGIGGAMIGGPFGAALGSALGGAISGGGGSSFV